MDKIEQKLDSVFTKQNKIDSQLQAGSSTVLTHKLKFIVATKPHSTINALLKGKYTNLAQSSPKPARSASPPAKRDRSTTPPTKSARSTTPPAKSARSTTPPPAKSDESAAGPAVKIPPVKIPPVKKSPSGNHIDDGEGLPQPAVVLFPADQLDHNWKHPAGGAGLQNCGNTCFLNAVTQCLVHTPPLTNYLMSSDHFKHCKVYNRDKCILCNMYFLMKRSLNSAADSFNPKWFINNLQYIGRHFRNGRQEDAHEYLRLSLEKMQKCALVGVDVNDKYSKETTVINQIFGGFLRSQVICLKCRARSNTYDPVLDISLDIKNVDSIERAFQMFVAPDRLDMDNAYKCEKCKQKVQALKRFTIHKAPCVLTIQLKRFQYGQANVFGGGGKISKFVKYPARLNLRPYMSNKNGPPEVYSLFATIQHEGFSCQSGHYVANVRCGQRWYHFNDSMKRRTSMHQCLSESSAYVLFYIKDLSPPTVSPSSPPRFKSQVEQKAKTTQNGTASSTASKFIGPVKPQVIKTPEKPSSTKTFANHNGIQSNGIKTNGIKRPVPSPVAPLAEREKIRISFGSKPQKATTPPKTSKNNLSPKRVKAEIAPPGTPRLVMKIKDGKSITIETSPDGERRILSDDDEVIAKMNERRPKKLSKKSRLVPYPDDSSSDSDWSGKKATATTNGHGQKQRNGIVFDQRLNATTSVPGNTHLYETVTVKDKINHHSHTAMDSKPPSTKASMSTPLKRQFSETLTCVTTPTPSKHAGGAEWHTSDAMLSPSIGSLSSAHSNNSTSDWSVSNGGKPHPSTSSDRVHEGWTVTPGKHDTEKSKTAGDPSSKNDHKVSGDIAEKKEHVGSSKSLTNLKRQVMQEQMRPDDLLADVASPTTSDKACLLDTGLAKDSPLTDHSLYTKLKKHKKHKKHKHGDRERERHHDKYEELADEDESDERRKKKKKKKKHRHRDRDSDSVEERDRYRSKHEDTRPAGIRPTEHNGARPDERRPDERNLGKRKPESRETEDDMHKRKRVDSESSSEFEWVEKTVPTPTPTPLKVTKSLPATPSQSWDQLIGQKRSSSGYTTPVKSHSWDGLKTSKVVSQLEKLHEYGYGAPVSSWDGQRSQMDADRNGLERLARKRFSDDDYDEEFDRGKVKKVKQQHSFDARFNGNIFQDEQTRRNKDKTSWSDIKVGDNNPFLKQNGQSSFSTQYKA